MNYLILITFYFNILFVYCGEKQPSNNTATCLQETGAVLTDSNTACQTIDVTNTGACGTAAPVLQRLTNEPCNSTVTARKKKTLDCNNNNGTDGGNNGVCLKRCYWSYYSRIVGQNVCVGKRIVTGLKSGDIQYKLGLQLQTPCTVNGLQKCVGEYGYITCIYGYWKVSAICDPEYACEQYNEVTATSASGAYSLLAQICNISTTTSYPVTIQKARCSFSSALSNSSCVLYGTSPPTSTIPVLPSSSLPSLFGFNLSYFLGRK